MAAVSPVIRLPRSKSISINRSNSISENMGYQNQILFTNELLFEDRENRLLDNDIYSLLQQYNLMQITRDQGCGYLSFSDSKNAELVYSLFNGYTFPNQTILDFKLSANDIIVEGPILEIRNLPADMDHHQLYEIFRAYGSLNICKMISDNDKSRGRAIIQYFFLESSNHAVNDLNNKLIDGYAIQISTLVMNNFSQHQVEKHSPNSVQGQDTKPEGGYVDYLNLYIKNLDSSVDNSELFSLFRKFGRIVSARVMTHPVTRQSKGYGFVSYGKEEEAHAALVEMNGYQYRSKPMVVSYHVLKKPRQEKSSSTTTSSFHSPPPSAPLEYVPSVYYEPKHPHEVGLGIENVDQLTMNMKDMSVNCMNSPVPRKLSNVENSYIPPPVRHSPQFNTRPSLASLASGVAIQPAPTYEKIQEESEYKPKTLRRKGSLESVSSVMTESTANVQRQRMTDAVKRLGSFDHLSDIVDMLLTLKKKERSLCLFNPDFLKEKLNAAIEALEICEMDDSEEEEEEIVEIIPILEQRRKYKPSQQPTVIKSSKASYTKPNSVSPPSTVNNHFIDEVVLPPRESKAIPIVAPPPLSSSSDSGKSDEVKVLLKSIKGKPLHEQKQLLGDQLFPLVKATGIKHAPRITIRLLDTIELEILAHLMLDKERLKVEVEKAAISTAA